ncbi:hypothetical protein IJ750_07255 [bacterium]|nr:hypothetical protein [bacterium]
MNVNGKLNPAALKGLNQTAKTEKAGAAEKKEAESDVKLPEGNTTNNTIIITIKNGVYNLTLNDNGNDTIKTVDLDPNEKAHLEGKINGMSYDELAEWIKNNGTNVDGDNTWIAGLNS